MLQSKQMIDKLQTLVSNESRFKGMRDALHRWVTGHRDGVGDYITGHITRRLSCDVSHHRDGVISHGMSISHQGMVSLPYERGITLLLRETHFVKENVMASQCMVFHREA